MVKVAELFIPPRRILWLLRNLKDGSMTRVVSKKETFWDLPLVVLVNQKTLAGELLAAAIQRTNRGILIGQKTSGAAVNKTIVEQSDGSADKVKVADFYLKRGVPITDKGVTPDITLQEGVSEDIYINKAIEILKNKINQR
jgi:carboxyl-terminal processing protease